MPLLSPKGYRPTSDFFWSALGAQYPGGWLRGGGSGIEDIQERTTYNDDQIQKVTSVTIAYNNYCGNIINVSRNIKQTKGVKHD